MIKVGGIDVLCTARHGSLQLTKKPRRSGAVAMKKVGLDPTRYATLWKAADASNFQIGEGIIVRLPAGACRSGPLGLLRPRGEVARRPTASSEMRLEAWLFFGRFVPFERPRFTDS
jgi:hypothetical protein